MLEGTEPEPDAGFWLRRALHLLPSPLHKHRWDVEPRSDSGVMQAGSLLPRAAGKIGVKL
jgi:hypothetical protein